MIPYLFVNILESLMRRAAAPVDEADGTLAARPDTWCVLVKVRQGDGRHALADLPCGISFTGVHRTPLINSVCSSNPRFESAVASLHQ